MSLSVFNWFSTKCLYNDESPSKVETQFSFIRFMETFCRLKRVEISLLENFVEQETKHNLNFVLKSCQINAAVSFLKEKFRWRSFAFKISFYCERWKNTISRKKKFIYKKKMFIYEPKCSLARTWLFMFAVKKVKTQIAGRHKICRSLSYVL